MGAAAPARPVGATAPRTPTKKLRRAPEAPVGGVQWGRCPPGSSGWTGGGRPPERCRKLQEAV
eukprot:1611823-Alexandrium_andersonii.AAC.1